MISQTAADGSSSVESENRLRNRTIDGEPKARLLSIGKLRMAYRGEAKRQQR